MHTVISSDIILKIKQLEIFTRKLLNGSLVGDSRSAIKGAGFEFDQIREYTCGDDIRFIDWKASARSNKLLVKQYIEERSRTIYLVVDISHSSFFGSGLLSKKERITEIASVLALVAQHGKDEVGLLLFSDKVEAYIPPGTSIGHVHSIMETMFTIQPVRSQTDITVALKHLLGLKKRNGIVFLLSDFIDNNFERYMGQVSKKFDLVAVRCLDKNEISIPSVGFLTVEDIETGEHVELDVRCGNYIKSILESRVQEQNTLFRKHKVDICEVAPDRSDYLLEMIRFFRRRMMY